MKRIMALLLCAVLLTALLPAAFAENEEETAVLNGEQSLQSEEITAPAAYALPDTEISGGIYYSAGGMRNKYLSVENAENGAQRLINCILGSENIREDGAHYLCGTWEKIGYSAEVTTAYSESSAILDFEVKISYIDYDGVTFYVEFRMDAADSSAMYVIDSLLQTETVEDFYYSSLDTRDFCAAAYRSGQIMSFSGFYEEFGEYAEVENDEVSNEMYSILTDVALAALRSQLENETGVSLDSLGFAAYFGAADNGGLPSVKDYGECGDSAEWLMLLNGTLVISGSGGMFDFEGAAPWDIYRHDIHTLVIENGMEYLSAAFSDCPVLQELYIPSSVQRIADGAFSGSTAPERLFYDGKLPAWEQMDIGSGNGALTNAQRRYISRAEYDGECAMHLQGDINGDGSVNIKDAVAELKLITGEQSFVPAYDGDTNADGRLNMKDAVLLLKYVCGEAVTVY